MADFEYTEVEVVEQPSRSYRLDIANNRMLGKVDGLEAIKQAIYLRLSTERDDYLIYSEDYGIQLEDLVGEPDAYVLPTLQRRIAEALLRDERVLGVEDFYFTEEKGSVTAAFTVRTDWGDIVMEKEVDY
ncbi:DUF2634 domain-containing protein [Clostridium sp. KNHs205]|jgi:phage baseplate assembly protein W|uniref:DUF2634 domain-containing protein n=1 Tax=Clostridium sp. KNHs205 TaxID=1449050 RepID=UPI00051AED71|nr:DUF2634 domain-containing protein [Clostridium sp. KNHs205]